MTRRPANATAAVHYLVDLRSLNAHLFAVTLTIAQPAALQRVSLPVWIPGSYLVREFAKNLQQLQAHQGGQAVALSQLDKCSWQAQCLTNQALVLQYEIYALDNSVRTAWLDGARGFFNGTSLFLRVEGQEALPHELTLLAHPDLSDWQLATGLTPGKTTRDGFGTYLASGYDELVDCPVEMGPFWHGAFVAAASRTGLSSRALHPPLMASNCWPTRNAFAKQKSSSGMACGRVSAPRPSHRIKPIASCSAPWTTVTAVWNTAIQPHSSASARTCHAWAKRRARKKTTLRLTKQPKAIRRC